MATAPVVVAQPATGTARLWVGPKLVSQSRRSRCRAGAVVDYSRFSVMAGWARACSGCWAAPAVRQLGLGDRRPGGLVKILLFPLANAQYKSMAKMRKFQPRLRQLKERYGDDKQKFEVAMMELYKKEDQSGRRLPAGAAADADLLRPVLGAAQSVELRHAPWIGWIRT